MQNIKNSNTSTIEEDNIPTAFQSAVAGKCPRCRKGNMFKGPLFSVGPKKMHTHCPHCGIKFEKEPGYFYVAMYITYAFVVAQLVAACVATYVLAGNSESPWPYLYTSLITVVIFAPFNYRYSRIVLLHWMTPQFRFNEKLFHREAVK